MEKIEAETEQETLGIFELPDSSKRLIESMLAVMDDLANEALACGRARYSDLKAVTKENKKRNRNEALKYIFNEDFEEARNGKWGR